MRAQRTDPQSLSLFTQGGERKYLSREERRRFHDALAGFGPEIQTFCGMLFWTGCRPSEALVLTQYSINFEARYVVIRSLKKRGEQKGQHYRIVPLPRPYVERLGRVHALSTLPLQQLSPPSRLWCFSRTKAWEIVSEVMAAADISGARACARGLRHSFGVNAALNHVPETRIQRWLGHASLTTTAIYLDIAALEDREIARRMWQDIYPCAMQTGQGASVR